MTLVLAFAPFIVFSLLVRLSVDLALWLSFATAFAVGMQSFLHTRVLKFLDAASTAVFGFLAFFCGFIEPGLPVAAIRLVVDMSLLAAVVASLIARQPLTIQYAREHVPREMWSDPEFQRENYVLTAVWACAFIVMSVVDGAAAFNPNVSLTAAVALGLAALACALAFTWRYPVLARQSKPRPRG